MNLTHNRNLQPAYWGLLHGINDLAAGFLLAAYTLAHGYSDSFLFISIYAILGFGGQLPVGFWLDKQKDISLFAILSVALLPLSLLFFFVSIEVAIICSGMASAFVHVTGGTICLQVHENKSGPLGLFTAPGVLGLTIGSLLGEAGYALPVVLILATSFVTIAIFRQSLPVYQTPEIKESELDSHDLVMLMLLLFMCFRSFLFDVVNYVAENYEDGLIYIGVSAFLGKMIGGFVADKAGIRKFIYGTLVAALILFQFGKTNIYMLCAGIALLQSSVPLTLLLMSRSLSHHPAVATAFSLGIPVALAGLPLYLVSDKRIIHDGFEQPVLAILFFIVLFAVWILLEIKLIKQKIL